MSNSIVDSDSTGTVQLFGCTVKNLFSGFYSGQKLVSKEPFAWQKI
jgi:hypothetical protein